MSTTGRAFVAVVPSDEALDAIDFATASLRGSVPDARWTMRDQWHVTLQFLGNHVDLNAVAGALGALSEVGGDARLGGGGAFPGEGRGRVLWLGLAEGTELVGRLASAVGTLLTPVGYEPDTRPFHAHLTLARLKAPSDLRVVVAALDAMAIGPAWPVDEVVLFQSHTRRTGAEYEELARTSLAPRTAPSDRDGAPVG